MKNLDLDLESFKLKDTLNPAIFDLSSESMHSDVLDTLYQIGEDFYETLSVDKDYYDIWLVGSNASYNWSDFSDVDLHVIYKFDEGEDKDFLLDYFDSKKNNWNNSHNIKIDIHEIEVYVQDYEEDLPEYSGIYSITEDAWIRRPEKVQTPIDEDAVMQYVNKILRPLSSGNANVNTLKDIEKNAKKIRKAGLKSGGEFSPANIAYKALRRKGIFKKIKEKTTSSYDKTKSLNKKILSYGGSKNQRILSGNKAYVKNLDKYYKKKKDEKYTDGIFYSIHGVMYESLRDAAAKTSEKKSTIQYRLHSTNPKFSDYKIVYKR
jgi:predicted nucleotidyltransferase